MFEDTPHNATLKECDEEDGLDGGEEDRNPLFEEDNSHNTILLRPSHCRGAILCDLQTDSKKDNTRVTDIPISSIFPAR